MSNLIGRVCMVRTYSAGVFIGTVAERDGREVTLTNARRIWDWDGAATLAYKSHAQTQSRIPARRSARLLRRSPREYRGAAESKVSRAT